MASGAYESNAAWERRTASARRAKIFEILGGRCCRCGFDNPLALQIDHIRGGGTMQLLTPSQGGKAKTQNRRWQYAQVLKSLDSDKAAPRYQLLCANCNWIKRYANKECRQPTVP